MQRTSCWGMMSSSAADADDALLIKTGVEVQQLPVAIWWLCPFSLGKEGRGGYGRWPVPMDNSNCHNDGCARNCSCCRRQKMHSSTGSTPFAVWGKPISHHGISRDAFIGDDGGVANRCPFSGGRRLLRDMMDQSPRYSHCGLLPNSIGAATAD